MTTPFKPAWWLPGPHAQTLWSALAPRRVEIALTRERWTLPDGDFVDCDICDVLGAKGVVLLLHGLEGSIESAYAKGMMRALQRQGFASVFLHFRGCSGDVNRLPRAYHSGDTGDVAFVVETLQARYSSLPLFAIGYSLGGNVLLKWLGETGEGNPLQGVVAVSVPYVLNVAADRMARGFSRIYQRHLLTQLKQKVVDKHAHMPLAIDVPRVAQAKNFWMFDDTVTAPLHGFEDAAHYYQTSSSRPFLKNIAVNTLLLHAEDDPFMTPEVIPSPAELSPTVSLELSTRGGHVGFITGVTPGRGRYWLEERVPAYFREVLLGN